MKKKLMAILILTSLLLTFNTNIHAVNSTSNTILEVLESAWDEFGLFSYGVEETDSIISIGMDDTKSETKLRAYLNENLSEETKQKYNFKIFKGNIEELEKAHQERLLKDKMDSSQKSADLQ